MRKYITFVLALVCVVGLVGCSNPANEDSTGTITFYSEATKEFTAPVSATSLELSKTQEKEIKKILNTVTEWVDDHSVDRLAYYFDGEFQLSDSAFVYYFTYEYNVIYYDHYIGQVTAEEMQFIKNIQSAGSLDTTLYTDEELSEMPANEIPGATTFLVDIWDRTKEEQLDCADAIEKFYEDDTNEYYFSCVKSHYIIVMDNTGRTVDIVTALHEGLATIADLDSHGIAYYREPKK